MNMGFLFGLSVKALLFQPVDILTDIVNGCKRPGNSCVIKLALIEKLLSDYPKEHPEIVKINIFLALQKRKPKCRECLYPKI